MRGFESSSGDGVQRVICELPNVRYKTRIRVRCVSMKLVLAACQNKFLTQKSPVPHHSLKIRHKPHLAHFQHAMVQVCSGATLEPPWLTNPHPTPTLLYGANQRGIKSCWYTGAVAMRTSFDIISMVIDSTTIMVHPRVTVQPREDALILNESNPSELGIDSWHLLP